MKLFVDLQADVAHPAPHTTDRPSFASLVASVDPDAAKYIADCRVQKPRQEMIEDLGVMAKGHHSHGKYCRNMKR